MTELRVGESTEAALQQNLERVVGERQRLNGVVKALDKLQTRLNRVELHSARLIHDVASITATTQ